MFRFAVLLKKNTDYEITVANENAVVNVVSYPEGNSIAASADATFGFIVPAAAADRKAMVIVRGRTGTPAGDADFEIRGFQSQTTVFGFVQHVSFSADGVQDVPSLAAGTHVTTVEAPIGATDTLLLITDSAGIQTLAFDDDDGFDRMSFLRLSAACSGGCHIVVGRASGPTGPVNLVWDETIETAGHDPDKDGLSTELEGIVFTNPGSADSDGDGIADGFEVYGGQLKTNGTASPPAGAGKNGNLLKFPRYGANPIAADVFVEVDWVPACPASDAACSPLSPTPQLRPDFKRITAANATAVLNLAANSMNGAVRAHFDVGVPTSAGDAVAQTNVVFGDWGGANRLGDGQTHFVKDSTTGLYTSTVAPDTFLGFEIDQDCFTGSVGPRGGTFHHVIITDDHTNGRLPDFAQTFFESAACAFINRDDASMAHELGHNFKLHHGGFPSAADGDVNCKMNYASNMSYPNQGTNAFAPGYSFGRYQPRVLNGFTMNEGAGLGISPVTEGTILDVFENGSMGRGFVNRTTGGIDWNMDGLIEPGTVRAPANWANQTCGAPYFRANFQVGGFGVAFPTLTVSEASASAPQMWSVSNSRGNFSLALGTGNSTMCAQPGFGACTSWTWLGFPPVGAISSSFAVAGPLIVYRSTSGQLAYFRKVVTTSVVRGTSFTSQTLQSGSIAGAAVTGDAAAIEVNGRVKVYSVDAGGQLLGWEYDEAANTWSFATQAWEDGTPVHTGFGIALAHGAVRPAGQAVFAAIPNRDKAAKAGDPMPIEFATLSTTTATVTVTVPAHKVGTKLGVITVPAYSYSYTVLRDRWQRFGAANTPPAQAQFAKPGLGYVPFDLTSPNDGRFYLTWVNGDGGIQSRTARIMFTQGNDTSAGATSRRLAWMSDQQTLFADDNNQTRDLSRGVILGRFGQSVAGAAVGFAGPALATTTYFPAVDGIINADVRDYPDDLLVRHNLACSVHGSECDDSP
jgi:hypothetical protein